MISIPAAVAVFVIHEPVSFGCGIDGMRGHCVRIVQKDPISAGYFLFVNKRRNQARVIWYDGQGFLLCTLELLQDLSVKIQAKKGGPSICVHSNRSDPSTFKRAIELGADFVYPKPLSQLHLVKLLSHATGKGSKI